MALEVSNTEDSQDWPPPLNQLLPSVDLSPQFRRQYKTASGKDGIEFTDPNIDPAEVIDKWTDPAVLKSIAESAANFEDGTFYSYLQPFGSKEDNSRHGHLFALRKQGNVVEVYFVDPENAIDEQVCQLFSLRLDASTGQGLDFADLTYKTAGLDENDKGFFKFRRQLAQAILLADANGKPPCLQGNERAIDSLSLARPGRIVIEDRMSSDWVLRAHFVDDANKRAFIITNSRLRTLSTFLQQGKLSLSKTKLLSDIPKDKI